MRLVIEKRPSFWHWSLEAMKIQFFQNLNFAQVSTKKNTKSILTYAV